METDVLPCVPQVDDLHRVWGVGLHIGLALATSVVALVHASLLIGGLASPALPTNAATGRAASARATAYLRQDFKLP